MEVIQDQFDMEIAEKVYIVLGSFDGLHIGHMSLVQRALYLSKQNHCKCMVYTFENHPRTITNPDFMPKLIMDNSTKIKILDKIGVDIINLVRFDEKFMKIQPEEFINKIVKCYNVQGIVVGYNYKFGYKNGGDISLLKEMGKRLGFQVHIVEPVEFEGTTVSSSRIRQLISEGKVEKANAMLFQPYCIEGIVEDGKKIGRKLGFPTANIQVQHSYIIPLNGVYYTVVECDGNRYKGITNVGKNPTVHGKTLTVETHILGFDEEIYNKRISVYFIEKIRDEFKFNSVEELSAQIQKDKLYAEDKEINEF